ncbi:MAG TPA: helix-turn-helix transcriptional regulator, partial [Thermoanaerobaculia bacterium]|nr:helix-turn-helix transcriptional regulator [Thermoanaerobaculia bacterium]
ALRDPLLAKAWSAFQQITAPADLYFAQRALISRLMNQSYADRAAAENAVLGFADTVVQLIAAARPRKVRSRSHRLVEDAKTLLASSRHWSLSEIAGELNVTAYSLCKTFRAATGITLGEYRRQLRLRSALDRLRDGERDLTGLALDHGFSSHSHFTHAFRQTFGMTPSEYRKML